MKLWQKEGTSTNQSIEAFTVGKDKEFDILLAKYDVIGSIAHVTMLGEQGLLTLEEADTAVAELNKILNEIENGEFVIDEGMEDIHSQVEFSLTQRVGEVGKRIHSGRSRNDQVALDIKLYLKDQILELKNKAATLFALLSDQSEKYKNYSLPGYTHLQLAMPSSFGLWFGAYAESLVDDMEVLLAAYNVVNKNPLGSGAGYGSSFPLNRQRTTELLGFHTLNYNSVYAQMTRGKSERIVAQSMNAFAYTLNKIAVDCCLYMNQNFAFIKFPDHLTTGSSIMPHKKNPDVFELIRGKCNRLQSLQNEMTLLTTNLPSGYHREMQLTKEIIFPAIEELKSCFDMTQLMLSNIEIQKNILNDPKYELLFTVDSLNEMVIQGIPFRDAYKIVGNAVSEGRYQKPTQLLDATRAHEGSIHRLCTDEIKLEFKKIESKFL
jgi:argininosuccinate lyase